MMRPHPSTASAVTIRTGSRIATASSRPMPLGASDTSPLRLSRATMRNIRQNLFLAFIYNAIGVPVAAGVLYPAFHVLISPIWASAAMTFSSVSVIANALRLRKVKL